MGVWRDLGPIARVYLVEERVGGRGRVDGGCEAAASVRRGVCARSALNPRSAHLCGGRHDAPPALLEWQPLERDALLLGAERRGEFEEKGSREEQQQGGKKEHVLLVVDIVAGRCGSSVTPLASQSVPSKERTLTLLPSGAHSRATLAVVMVLGSLGVFLNSGPT